MGRIDDESGNGSVAESGNGRRERYYTDDDPPPSAGEIVRSLARRPGVNRESLQEFLSRRGPQNNKQPNGGRGNG